MRAPRPTKVRSYTAEFNRFRVLATLKGGEVVMSLYANNEVDFSGHCLAGGVFPRDELIKEAKTRLRSYQAYQKHLRWDRKELVREVYLLATSCNSFEEFVSRFIRPQ